MSNYLGRCNDCDYALFATGADIKTGDNAVAGGPAVNVGNGRVMGRCTNRHRWFALKPVKGTFSEKHQCDSRCLNAKGHDCTCSCGGANHGRGHAVTVTQVKAEAAVSTSPQTLAAREARNNPIPVQVSDHLGEVGKHITGEVTVTKVLARDNFVIINFVTNSGNKIVWFAPTFAVPAWEEGDKLTIRAKVKKHEDHPQFGKSTVVTYVEEV